MSFVSKKIAKIETLGEKLKRHREAIGWSKEKIARKIEINANYIDKLETDNFEALPPDVYTVNIIKIYAEFLKLNPYMVIDLYKKEKTIHEKLNRKNELKKLTAKQKILNFLLNPKILKYFLSFFAIIVMVVYLAMELYTIFKPPQLEIISPPENHFSQTGKVAIQGQTEKEVQLKINERSVLTDPNGRFEIIIDLQNGLNSIKISAKKKHSQENVIYRNIIVLENENK